jgi:hypothetical protein
MWPRGLGIGDASPVEGVVLGATFDATPWFRSAPASATIRTCPQS